MTANNTFPYERKLNAARFCLYFFKQRKWPILIIFLGITLFAMGDVLFNYVVKVIIDDLPASNSMFIPYALFILVLMVRELGMRFQQYINLKMLPFIKKDIQTILFQYIQGHSYHFFQTHMAGNVGGQIINVSQVFHTIFYPLRYAIYPSLIILISSFVIFCERQFHLGITLLIWYVFVLCLMALPYRTMLRLGREYAESQNNLVGHVVDSFQNIYAVKQFNQEKNEQTFLNDHQTIAIATEQNLEKGILTIDSIRGLLSIFFFGILLLFLISGYQEGKITLGDISFVMTSAFHLMRLVWWSSMEVINIFRDLGKIDKTLELIHTSQEISDANDAISHKVKQAGIIFKNVTFHYPERPPLFSHLSINIRPKEKVGIVGYSGGGKTTFFNLLQRFYEPQEGYISIDSIDIRQLSNESLRACMTIIPQEPILFHRSILDNILFGNEKATFENVVDACHTAHAIEFIESLPQGFETIVGERGVRLSVGQRQRVIIARAVLRNAPILLMDEATSSLDSDTEQKIQEGLSALMHDKTTLVIAHRLSTLLQMDRIIVFSKGKIVEDGCHQDLLNLNGLYAKLWSLQSLQLGGILMDRETDNV